MASSSSTTSATTTTKPKNVLMDRDRIRLQCLYDMFRDQIEEDVIFIVYTENEGKIDTTIGQLMSISACSFTGHDFTSSDLNNTLENGDEADHCYDGTNNNRCKQTTSSSSSSSSSTGASRQALNNNCSINLGLDENDKTDKVASINEQIESLQQNIDDLLEEKRNSHEKAQKYMSKKMYPVTSYYSDLSGQLRLMIERKTAQLVELLLQLSDNKSEIDLHGLNPIQARLVVGELLKIRQEALVVDKKGEVSVDIITGWGKHTIHHGHRVKPAVVNLLREKGFEYHHLNKGALRVTIRR